MLLPAYRRVKIDCDEQHTIFRHELQSAWMLTVGFSNVYCEMYQICNLCVTNVSFEQ